MRTFNGSTHWLQFPVQSNNNELNTSATNTATTIRFKTSSTTDRQMLYSVGIAANVPELYIDINASVAGQLRFIVWNGTSFFTLSQSSVADGNWHTVTIVRNGASTWRMFFDGAQVGTDQTLTFTNQASPLRAMGRYYDPDGDELENLYYWTGSVELLAYHAGMTLSQHAAIHNGTKHVWNCGAGCTGFVPFGPSTSVLNGDVHTYYDPRLRIRGDATDGVSPSLEASTPDRVYGMGTADVTLETVEFLGLELGEVVAKGPPGATDRHIREISNVYRASDGDWCLVYSGMTAEGANDPQLHLATSSDRTTWEKQGVIISGAVMNMEDAYVLKWTDDKYYLFAENRESVSVVHVGIALWRSDNGKSGWTLLSEDLIPKSTDDGSPDRGDISSPSVYVEGSRIYVAFEGRPDADVDAGDIGLAWSDDGPEGPYTKYNAGVNEADPIISRSADTWFDDSLVPDELKKVGDTYYLLAHGADGTHTYTCGVFSSGSLPNPGGWSPAFSNPITTGANNTVMMVSDDIFELYGVNELTQGALQGSIIRYGAFGTYAEEPAWEGGDGGGGDAGGGSGGSSGGSGGIDRGSLSGRSSGSRSGVTFFVPPRAEQTRVERVEADQVTYIPVTGFE